MTHYGTITTKRITKGMYKAIRPTYNKYSSPVKLTKCKYKLMQHDRIRKVITTDTLNREAVLLELIEFVNKCGWRDKYEFPAFYIITVKENGVEEVLIDSRIPSHLNFARELCLP